MSKSLRLSVYPEDISREFYKDSVNKKGDSGCDLFCPNDFTVPAGARSFCIDLQVRVSMYNIISLHPAAVVGGESDIIACRGCLLYPRSSMGSTTTLRMCNSVGVIDMGYRGSIKAYVDNVGEKDVEIKRGTRLFQICAGNLKPFTTHIVDSLNSTERGETGFGSTGGTIKDIQDFSWTAKLN